MSYHGSGVEKQLYDTLRAYMFGAASLSAWSEEDLNDKQAFIDWVIEECDWQTDFDGELDEAEVRKLASMVFDNELEQYRQGAD